MGGDIDDPRDAILAAANYLSASGAPRDIDRALFAYNHSRAYVRAIRRFAARMRADERAFLTLYAWQVYVARQPACGASPAPARAAAATPCRAARVRRPATAEPQLPRAERRAVRRSAHTSVLEPRERGETEHRARLVRAAPEPAVHRAVAEQRLWVALAIRRVVQVVHEQRGHQHPAGVGREDLDPERVRLRVRRGEHAVLRHRARPGGGRDVEGDRVPARRALTPRQRCSRLASA